MEHSLPEGELNSTVINASEGNDELNDDGVVNQEEYDAWSTCDVILHDIQGPSRVKTKGRPKGKRLGADKSIKKSMEKRKRKSQPDVVDLQIDNDRQGSVDNRFEDSTIWNSSDGGRFMNLLNSFRHL
ncbi:hypothetical protein S83_034947 [Arachis hypogaea]